MGVVGKAVSTVAQLTKLYIPPSNFFVTPFLAFCESAPAFDPDIKEVAAVLDVPLEMLLDDSLAKETIMGEDGVSYVAPYYDLHGRVVW